MPHGVRGEPLATGHDRHEFGDHPLGQRDIGRLAGQGQRVAAGMDIGGEDVFQSPQILVGGT